MTVLVLLLVGVYGVGSWWLVGQANRRNEPEWRPSAEAGSANRNNRGGQRNRTPLQALIDFAVPHPALAVLIAVSGSALLGAFEASRWSGNTRTIALHSLGTAAGLGAFATYKILSIRRRRLRGIDVATTAGRRA
jgi:hypothetical protein